eukprot:1142338-Pelagomonas_calceolata.AAC.11
MKSVAVPCAKYLGRREEGTNSKLHPSCSRPCDGYMRTRKEETKLEVTSMLGKGMLTGQASSTA